MYAKFLGSRKHATYFEKLVSCCNHINYCYENPLHLSNNAFLLLKRINSSNDIFFETQNCHDKGCTKMRYASFTFQIRYLLVWKVWSKNSLA